jgi:NAD(P)-dependent dehydrogenase (short-subunit alcohol dehydrogenase family)
MSDGPLTGKTAFVTGASSGLGRHFALTLARAGCAVMVGARRTGALDELCAEIDAAGGRARATLLDVTDAASVRAAVAAAERELGGLDILVNNAGVNRRKPLLDLDEADWDFIVDTNLKGTFLMATEVARLMCRQRRAGSIINIGSVLSFRQAPLVSIYAASKAAVAQLTRVMALELAPHHIRVNAIAPGYIETDLNREFLASEVGRAIVSRIPMGHTGRKEDLDGPLLLLASDESAFMTGAVITVDGGHLTSSL